MTTVTETYNVAPKLPGQEFLAEVKRPMCGFASQWIFQPHSPRVILCPCDDGGCDRYYVAKVTLKANVHTMTIND